jgi:hypothetical protein
MGAVLLLGGLVVAGVGTLMVLCAPYEGHRHGLAVVATGCVSLIAGAAILYSQLPR